VFGEGAEHAEVFMIGEQPGGAVYITNVVKHFKWTRKGKLRIHQKPRADEIEACRPWLEAEIALTRPKAIVCLGATAAQALLGRKFRVTQHHGELISTTGRPPIAGTIHPSAILRATTDEDRHRMMDELVNDLKAVARLLSR
jgi:DNA polymerase